MQGKAIIFISYMLFCELIGIFCQLLKYTQTQTENKWKAKVLGLSSPPKSPLTSEIESGKKSATKAPVAYMLPARRFSSQQFKRVTVPSKFILL